MVFGTFDKLHPGHHNFLEQAKRYAEELIVVIARDKTIKQVKKKNPFLKEKDRLAQIKKISLVTGAILGNLRDKYQVILKHKPDIICLGYDQTHFTDNLKEKLNQFGLRKTKIIRLKPYCPEKYKSSKL